MPALPLLAICVAVILCGCTARMDGTPGDQASTAASPTGSPQTQDEEAPAPSPPATPPATASPTLPPTFDPAAAYAVVEQLAVGIGPREASSASFAAAADLVAASLRGLGYGVQVQELPVPAGNSWGVPVPSGTTRNVIATPPGVRPQDRHRLIGAHLDTVPQAPGAEDNASGVGVMLELARMASEHPPAVPVVFVAFGAEEPRGSGDALHHFGSQHMVAAMDAGQRAALAGMLSLDRVGVAADHVPVCHGGRGSAAVREELVAVAGNIGVPVQRCENRASDHWSFEKAAVPAARMGSIPYAGYHSPADVPSVVDPAQLDRVGRIAAEWMLTQP